MMFRRKEKRSVPGLNTTSTADISFMLLILFLVASSMDLDRGWLAGFRLSTGRRRLLQPWTAEGSSVLSSMAVTG